MRASPATHSQSTPAMIAPWSQLLSRAPGLPVSVPPPLRRSTTLSRPKRDDPHLGSIIAQQHGMQDGCKSIIPPWRFPLYPVLQTSVPFCCIRCMLHPHPLPDGLCCYSSPVGAAPCEPSSPPARSAPEPLQMHPGLGSSEFHHRQFCLPLPPRNPSSGRCPECC